jgi:hypothetical protein
MLGRIELWRIDIMLGRIELWRIELLATLFIGSTSGSSSGLFMMRGGAEVRIQSAIQLPVGERIQSAIQLQICFDNFACVFSARKKRSKTHPK